MVYSSIRNKIISGFICLLFFNCEIKAYDLGDEYPYQNKNICDDPYDPLEGINRKIFVFNGFLDTITLRPAAKVYKFLLNDYLKDRVWNFVNNVESPVTVVNNVFQFNGREALNSFWHFIINATLGIGGIYDVASKFGINYKLQTFGDTLAYYGVPPGPYLVLPILGSTNARDMLDVISFNTYLNPLKLNIDKRTRRTISVVRVISTREKILEFTDYVTNTALDPYIVIREYIWKNRQNHVLYPYKSICYIK